MVIKSNTHTTVVQREERTVVYLCSFEAQTQMVGKKKKQKKTAYLPKSLLPFSQVSDLHHTSSFWNLTEVFRCSEQVISNTENTWIPVLPHALFLYPVTS